MAKQTTTIHNEGGRTLTTKTTTYGSGARESVTRGSGNVLTEGPIVSVSRTSKDGHTVTRKV